MLCTFSINQVTIGKVRRIYWRNETSVLTQTILGPTGFINADLVKKHIAPASLKEKVKVFVCGMCFVANDNLSAS